MEEILKYINEKYSPVSIIVYGSYSDGTNNLGSDFDALVISKDCEEYHDTSFVGGIQLDVFVYPSDFFCNDYDLSDFIQIAGGIIVKDTDGIGEKLKSRIEAFIDSKPQKTRAELKSSIDWCVKMLKRTARDDAESLFRWHWLLTDSLEIFCDISNEPYRGPKKSLLWMSRTYPEAFRLYTEALRNFTSDALYAWVEYIRKSYE